MDLFNLWGRRLSHCARKGLGTVVAKHCLPGSCRGWSRLKLCQCLPKWSAGWKSLASPEEFGSSSLNLQSRLPWSGMPTFGPISRWPRVAQLWISGLPRKQSFSKLLPKEPKKTSHPAFKCHQWGHKLYSNDCKRLTETTILLKKPSLLRHVNSYIILYPCVTWETWLGNLSKRTSFQTTLGWIHLRLAFGCTNCAGWLHQEVQRRLRMQGLSKLKDLRNLGCSGIFLLLFRSTFLGWSPNLGRRAGSKFILAMSKLAS